MPDFPEAPVNAEREGSDHLVSFNVLLRYVHLLSPSLFRLHDWFAGLQADDAQNFDSGSLRRHPFQSAT